MNELKNITLGAAITAGLMITTAVMADDVVVSPAAGDGLVVTDAAAANERFRVMESGELFIEGLLATSEIEDQPLCYDSVTGRIGDCPAEIGTDDQQLSLAGDTLTLEDGGSVDLTPYVNTDNQSLALAGNTLSLTNGGSVDLTPFVDTDDQMLGLAGTTLSLTDGGSVDLTPFVDTDDQMLGLAGNTLSLTDGGSVDLTPYVNTDAQTLSNVLSQGNSAGSQRITNLSDPTGAQDAATKSYVDSAVSSGAGVISGAQGGSCVGTATDTTPITCTINLGAAVNAVVVMPDSSNTSLLTIHKQSFFVGDNSVDIVMYGDADGTTSIGVSWIATPL